MRVRLAPDARSAGKARSLAAEFLRTLRPPSHVDPDDVLLAVSELVTNALEAGAARIDLELTGRTGAVVIRVEDDAAGVPAQRRTDQDDERGRGLEIVAHLALEWYVDRTPEGKAVVAVLGAAGPATG